MKRLALLLASLALLVAPGVGWCQNTETLPPACTVTGLSAGCVPAVQGVRARVTDGDSATDCTTGSGSTTVTCEYSGSAWTAVTSGVWVGANGESINNGTDGTFDFTRDDAGTVTLTASDDDATAALTVTQGGAAALTLGSTSTTTTTVANDGLNLDIDVNGGTLALRNEATGSVVLEMRDYGDTDDDDMAHAAAFTNCTATGTGAEECDLTFRNTQGGANVDVLTFDADGGYTLGAAGDPPASVTVNSDDTGDAELTIPTNSVGTTERVGTIDTFVTCGQLDENGTIYFGPATGSWLHDGTDYSLGSTICDGLDDATEATADDILLVSTSIKVHGFFCHFSGTLGSGETIAFTARSAEADIATTDGAATTLTCTISEAEDSCVATAGSTTSIADNATIAMQAVMTSDNADDDAWCEWTVGYE